MDAGYARAVLMTRGLNTASERRVMGKIMEKNPNTGVDWELVRAKIGKMHERKCSLSALVKAKAKIDRRNARTEEGES